MWAGEAAHDDETVARALTLAEEARARLEVLGVRGQPELQKVLA
ncbi:MULTISPECIES: hypothetical protein [Myxococcus]|nr:MULTISPECIES: hypothetical protein [Myxococcus]